MANHWLSVDEVRRQQERAAKHVAIQTSREFMNFTSAMLPEPTSRYNPLESPLEAIFWLWWQAEMFGCHEGSNGSYLWLDTQREVVAGDQNYRLDFVIRLKDDALAREFDEADRPFPLIAVEVDGHGFHEKTPEQVALRNARDRALQQAGWLVFHFSWTEMVAAGADCVGEVVDVAVVALTECRRAVSDKWAQSNPEANEKALKAIAAVLRSGEGSV